jgi:hypothetical protein
MRLSFLFILTVEAVDRLWYGAAAEATAPHTSTPNEEYRLLVMNHLVNIRADRTNSNQSKKSSTHHSYT